MLRRLKGSLSRDYILCGQQCRFLARRHSALGEPGGLGPALYPVLNDCCFASPRVKRALTWWSWPRLQDCRPSSTSAAFAAPETLERPECRSSALLGPCVASAACLAGRCRQARLLSHSLLTCHKTAFCARGRHVGCTPSR